MMKKFHDIFRSFDKKTTKQTGYRQRELRFADVL